MKQARREFWTYGATALFVLLLLALVYLGSRPGGRLPVGVQRYGLVLLAGLALLNLALGLVLCALHRPVLQRGRALALTLLGITILLGTFPFAYPSSHEGRPSRTSFRLPFEGPWRCLWGGLERARNPLLLDPARCFGFTFETASAPARVVAPAAGSILALTPVAGGVRLALKVAEDETVFLEPLEPDSVQVQAGDQVTAGTALGSVPMRPMGSGKAGLYLLQMYLQDDPEPGWGEGVPLLFRDYRSGSNFVEQGAPVGAFPGHEAPLLQSGAEAAPAGR